MKAKHNIADIALKEIDHMFITDLENVEKQEVVKKE